MIVLPELEWRDSVNRLQQVRAQDNPFADFPVEDGAPAVAAMPSAGVLMREYLSHGKHVARLVLILVTSRVRRSQGVVKNEYERYTERKAPDWNTLTKYSTYRVGRRWAWLPALAFRRGISRAVYDAVSLVDAHTVLEVGCGEGVNLGLLSRLYPGPFRERTWLGFDYSATRTRRAIALMTGHLRLDNVFVWNGDAKYTGLKPDVVDLCFTCHVMEQMPYYWRSALTEMRRISRFVLLAEPFYEHKSLVGKMHSKANDYFKASVAEVCGMGFKLLTVAPLTVQDRFNETTVVLLQRV